MTSDTTHPARRRIAVIGAGISGMAAAHELAKDHHVTLYEAEDRLGGHARTRMGGKNGDQPVDTGFIVFNYANYPHLAALFAELDVPVMESNMSFGASIAGGRFEYALTSLDALFAQRRNAANPRFLRMVRDILHFNKNGLRIAREYDGLTVGGLIAKLGAGTYFRDYYLLPFSGAIWSTPTQKIMDFPADAMMTFFENHALLGVNGQHQWFTVEGGSIEYVRRLDASMKARGVHQRLGAPVGRVTRDAQGVAVTAAGVQDWFDDVIFATHSDDSLSMIADPSGHESATLGAVKYQPNNITLHSDTTVMPQRKKVWASWVYCEDADKRSDRIDLTYWMNSLQPWLTEDPLFVTMNTTRTIDPALIWDTVTLRHPVYDIPALAAQKQAAVMNGTKNTWFCGAWMRNGFHEDGIATAMDVVDAIRARDAMGVAAQ